ncbi:MAG: NUDIX hydrolase [Thermoplasmata archaeon]
MAHDEAAVGIINITDELIFIKRKEREGDPWSGDIAFPGGFVKEGEKPEEAAIREIREEISLDLSLSNLDYELPLQKPFSKDIKVHPFVMHVYNTDGMRAGDEVQEIRKIPLNALNESYDPLRGKIYKFRGWIIWGMTCRILSLYLSKR